MAETIEKMAGHLGTLAEKYGPETVDTALTAARVHGAGNIAVGAFLIAAVVSIPWKRFFVWVKATDGDGPVMLFIVAVGLAPMGGIAGAIMLLDIWNWVAVIEPKLWVAKKLMGM